MKARVSEAEYALDKLATHVREHDDALAAAHWWASLADAGVRLGQEISEECLRRGVTKKKLAEAMDVPPSTFRGV